MDAIKSVKAVNVRNLLDRSAGKRNSAATVKYNIVKDAIANTKVANPKLDNFEYNVSDLDQSDINTRDSLFSPEMFKSLKKKDVFKFSLGQHNI